MFRRIARYIYSWLRMLRHIPGQNQANHQRLEELSGKISQLQYMVEQHSSVVGRIEAIVIQESDQNQTNYQRLEEQYSSAVGCIESLAVQVAATSGAVERIEAAVMRAEATSIMVRRLLLLKELHPDLLKVLKPSIDIDNRIMNTLQYRSYASALQNGSLAEYFINEALDVVQSSSAYPPDAGTKVFQECFTLAKNSRHSVLVRYIDHLYYCVGDIDAMLEACSEFERHPASTDSAFSLVWRQYLNALLLQDKHEKAKEVLERYVALYSLDGLENFLMVANFARQGNCSNDNIAIASEVFQHIKKNQTSCLIENLISDKSIAIVGNSPNELDLGKGAAIDAHDIVVRFNDYMISDKFAEDYGSKTDIWFINYHIAQECLVAAQTKLWITGPLEVYRLEMDVIRKFHNFIEKKACQLTIVPHHVFFRALKAMKHSSLSLGLLGITMLKDIYQNIYDENIYGFSYKTGDVNNESWPHYYDGNVDPLVAYVHDLSMEARYLTMLMGRP